MIGAIAGDIIGSVYPEGIKGAQATALAILMGRQGKRKSEKYISGRYLSEF